MIMKLPKFRYYFDWNIYNYIFPNEKASGTVFDNAQILFHLIKNILPKESCCIPYSHAHFLDLFTGTEEYYAQNLSKIIALTDGWKISDTFPLSSNLYLSKTENIVDDFLEYKNNQDESKLDSELISNLMYKYYQPKINDVIESNMEMNPEVKDFKEFQQIVDCDSFSDMNYVMQKILKGKRNNLFKEGQKQKNQLGDFDSFSSQQLKKAIDEVIRLSEFPYNSSQEFLDNFPLPNIPILTEQTNEMIKVNSILDMIGFTKETLKNKQSLQAVQNDFLHLGFGLKSHAFVTEDKNLRIRALFLAKWFEIPAQILSIRGFINIILSEILTFQNESKLKDNLPCSLEFQFDGRCINYDILDVKC